LLRTYSGLFGQFVPINEFQIAKRLGRPIRDIEQGLNDLHKHDLLHYVPQNDQPLLTFTTPRAEAKFLYISPVNLAQRKKVAEVRMQAMKRFVKTTTDCRQRELLSYFGEKNAPDCGKCDFCRSTMHHKTTEINSSSKKIRLEKVSRLLKNKSLSIKELTAYFADEDEKELIQFIRESADAGILRLTGDMISIN
jgi:ATP-dependent DNA helicase RecQ